MNAVCKWCAHFHADWRGLRVQATCKQGRTLKAGSHECPRFEREPGADDDRGSNER